VPRPSSASLRAMSVSVSRGSVVILDGVSLTVGPKSRIGVVGPNGVGKTTLLRVLAGLEEPDAGRVARHPATTTAGYLPQQPDRRRGETLRAFLGRHTGVASAEAELLARAESLADGGADAYDKALQRFLGLGGGDLDARAEAVCADLRLPRQALDVELGELSGGQAARASLAAILLSNFDVMLLDEPTNDLDFEGLSRLEEFIDDLTAGLVVVSHDRAFLERTVTTVVELDEHTRRVAEYGGGWKAYLGARAVARRHAEEAYTANQLERERLVDRARAQRQWAHSAARREQTGAKDRDKAQRDWRINRTEKQASKVRVTEKAIERLAVLEKPWEGWKLQLRVATAPRSGAVVARLEGAVVDRGDFRLGPLDLELRWSDRLAVVGPNGSGKTTLIDTLLGRRRPTSGSVSIGRSVVVGEIDQARSHFGSEQSVLRCFADAVGLGQSDARSLLAKVGLSAEHVLRPAATISPGERTRASLAVLAARGVNCLVLDEPTNHLDLPAIEQLEVALADFDGTLVLVTHDRRLLEAVRLTHVVDLSEPRPRARGAGRGNPLG
jgi:ATPase subunit of ABC transporter with duplicated ATPase domains